MAHGPWTHNTLIQLNIIGTTFGQQLVNVHCFEASAVQEATYTSDADRVVDAGLLADDWIANGKTTYLNCKTPEYTLNRVVAQVLEVKNQTSHRLSSVERSVATANTGTDAIASDEAYSSVVLRWRGVIAGKHHQGRTYMGPVSGAYIADGRLSTAGQGRFNAYRDAMIARYAVGGTKALVWIFTVYSRPYNMGEYQYATRKTGSLTVVTPPDYSGDSSNITSASTDTILRLQRRRELGVGA